MKEYDRVELIVEKEKYAKEGVHKGMNGWICDPRNINGQWLVCFDQKFDYNIATIPVKEEDLVVIEESPEQNDNMKEYDRVELISDKKKFVDLGLKKGATGTILGPKRNGYWYVVFEGKVYLGDDGVWTCSDTSAAVKDEDIRIIWASPE